MDAGHRHGPGHGHAGHPGPAPLQALLRRRSGGPGRRPASAEPVRALVTNDDGTASEGIAVLARAARASGLDVLVAAPSWDASGSSAAVTAVESGDRPVWREVGHPGLEAPALAVEAAPAFIVRAALGGTFGPPPDLVLSGVNHGLNTGEAIIHSGTVGAALTAGIGNVPAAAFSMDVASAGPGGRVHWDTAAFVASSVISWLVEAERPVVLNVNVPNVPGEALRGVRRAGLAPVGTVRTTVTEAGTGERLAAAASGAPPAPEGSDTALVCAGVASYTPISPVTEDRSSDPVGPGVGAAGRDGGVR